MLHIIHNFRETNKIYSTLSKTVHWGKKELSVQLSVKFHN